jgi:flagellar biosynthetic protein FlhB
MSQSQQELDANEPASAWKLEKARERGSIARSAELTFAAVLLAALACVHGLGARVVDELASLMGWDFTRIARDGATPAALLALVERVAGRAALAVAAVLFALWLAAVVAGALQARGVFAVEPLKPDFARLSPAAALERLFSARALHELVRSAARIVVSGAAMAAWASHRAADFAVLSLQSPRQLASSGLALVGSALVPLCGLALLFAALDWGFQHWDFLRRMRMSRREMRDEHKEREGDPRIRARLRELRLAWLRRARQLAGVRRADLLVTNPTHLAVALEYRHGEMPAPAIVARGSGELARRMREEARRHGVPVVEHVPLARALFALDEAERLVPEEHFEAVARILRWVFAARAGSPS